MTRHPCAVFHGAGWQPYWLSSKALAMAWLELAQALKYHEPGLGTRLRPRLYVKKNLKFNLVVYIRLHTHGP